MTLYSTRRGFIAQAGAVALASGLSSKLAIAAKTTSGLEAAAKTFLNTLKPQQAKSARFDFGGRAHDNWNFMGTYVKPGLPLERMTKQQKAAAYDLLSKALSKSGYEKLRLIMKTQDIMREMGDGPNDRNSERFSITVFGAPGLDSLWGFRIEGHHISLSWTLKDDEIVALTPASFSVIPQHIPIGKLKGKIVLDVEETLARKLINDLEGSKLRRAVFSVRKPGNVLAQAGREDMFKTYQGLPIAEMSSAQQDLIWQLIETTTVTPWPTALQENQRKRISEGDRQAVHFAWAGGKQPGDMFYYRLHGEKFVLELTNVLGNPEHLHAIYHDPERTLGKHVRT